MDGGTYVFDTFNLCLYALEIESRQFGSCTFLDEECKKIIDSRDTDFNKFENRLTYAYKFGSFNIQHLEKCISSFFNEYKKSDAAFPLENLKVCSLSNGPGFDIVGLLCALYKCKKTLKGLPRLNAVNLCDSWLSIYKTVVLDACNRIRFKYCPEFSFDIPPDNIQLIQSDIYTTLSAEAENVISDSNVLLMFKTFISSKATSEVFATTLKRIFSLLKPGALIFFVGSKNNTKNFSKDTSLGKAVKCIFGPQKVSLKKVAGKEISYLSVKPQKSGDAHFVVWQKRNSSVAIDAVKKKKTRRGKKKKVLESMQMQKDGDSVVDGSIDDTDAESEMSFTSCSKQSDSLSISDEFKDNSCTNSSSETNSQNPEKEDQNLSENDINHSINNITSIFHKVDIGASSSKDLECFQPNMLESMKESNNLKSDTQGEYPGANFMSNEFETQIVKDLSCSLKEEKTFQNKVLPNLVSQSLKECVSSDERLQSLKESVSGDKVAHQSLKECVSGDNITSQSLKESVSCDKVAHQSLKESVSGDKVAHQSLKECVSGDKITSQSLKESVYGDKVAHQSLKECVSGDKITSQSLKAYFPALKVASQPLQEHVSGDKVTSQSLEGFASGDKVYLKHLSNEISIVSDMPRSVLPPVAQNTLPNVKPNTPTKKKSKNKIKDVPKTTPQNNSSSVPVDQSSENLFPRNAMNKQNSNDISNHDIQRLIQRCDSLISSVENIAADIKQDIISRNDQSCMKKCHHTREKCCKLTVPCHCSCFANTVQSYCCRKTCGCNVVKNICTNSLPRENDIKVAYDCCFGTRSVNPSRPYIVIPLQNDHM